MVWVIAAIVMVLAVVARVVTLRQRPQIWWLSNVFALVTISIGAAISANEPAVNAALDIPNVAHLIACVLFVLAGGAVTLYVHTLRHDRPVPGFIGAQCGLAVMVGLVMIFGWVSAPVHGQSYPSFRDVPLAYPEAFAYEWPYSLYLIPVLANVSICGFGLVARVSLAEDPGRRIGVLMIAISTALGVSAHLLLLIRLTLQPSMGNRALVFATAADVILLIVLIGVAASNISILVMPHLAALHRSAKLIRRLSPLWLRLRDRYPSVVLNSPARWRPTLRAERMLIEITDGLRLLTLPAAPDTEVDPYRCVADAIRAQVTDQGSATFPVSTLLPVATSRREEEEQVLKIASQYGHHGKH